MYELDKAVRAAVRDCLKTRDSGCILGKTRVLRRGNKVSVTYFGKESEANQVFELDLKTKKFWFSNCGWPTRTSKLRINDCFDALDLPYQTFLSKKRFCIRNLKSGASWICGDGKVNSNELEERLGK